jgi:hypothetical protein
MGPLQTEEARMTKVKARKTPGANLAGALDLLRQIERNVGYGPASRDTLIEAMGHKNLTGTSARKLAVLNHYDLVSKSGSTYQISELGRRILMPHDATDEAAALVEAAKAPSFFRDIWAEYEGNALPAMLPNILVRQFGVHPNSSNGAAAVFRETAEFAGLLRNGVLYGDIPQNDPPQDPKPNATDEGEGERSGEAGSGGRAGLDVGDSGGPGTQVYSVPLDHGGRVARIELPMPVEAQDLTGLEHWVRYMKMLNTNMPDTSGN